MTGNHLSSQHSSRALLALLRGLQCTQQKLYTAHSAETLHSALSRTSNLFASGVANDCAGSHVPTHTGCGEEHHTRHSFHKCNCGSSLHSRSSQDGHHVQHTDAELHDVSLCCAFHAALHCQWAVSQACKAHGQVQYPVLPP